MASIDPLLRRNKDFAASGAHEGASIVAKHPVFVITCLDPRVDLICSFLSRRRHELNIVKLDLIPVLKPYGVLIE